MVEEPGPLEPEILGSGPVPPLPTLVTLGEICGLSGPQLPLPGNGKMLVLPS